MEGVCYQEQEVQPYLDADVTCNLIEGGREVRGLPTGPRVDAMCCFSPGQGVIGPQGMGSSAFSPGRRRKGQRSCRELGRHAEPWHAGQGPGRLATEACQARTLPSPGSPVFEIRILDFHNTRQEGHEVLEHTVKPCCFPVGNTREPPLAHAPAGPTTLRLPSDFWPASFKNLRAVSLSSSTGCKKSRTWVRVGLAWEWRPELQLNTGGKVFAASQHSYAEDSRKRLQDSPLPSGIHQHPAQLARCPPCMGTSCSIGGDWQL